MAWAFSVWDCCRPDCAVWCVGEYLRFAHNKNASLVACNVLASGFFHFRLEAKRRDGSRWWDVLDHGLGDAVTDVLVAQA